jgi:GNAT superfamily N-acetyltransferase
MVEFRLRRAYIRELPILVQQRRAMFDDIKSITREEYAVGDAGYRRFVRREMKARRMVFYVVVTGDGKVVAGGGIWLRETQPRPGFRGGKIPYLFSFYTDPGYRGRGLATLIVKEAMKWARERGYPWMTLHASPMGRGVYEKLGWESTTEMRYKFTNRGRKSP